MVGDANDPAVVADGASAATDGPPDGAGAATDGPPPDVRDEYGYDLEPGDRHWRAWVGPPNIYDIQAAMQFEIATRLGLREWHHLLEIGCGSLRSGRLFMTYLLPGRYCGIEPEQWLLQEGIDHQLGAKFIELRKPRFDHNTDFDFSMFDEQFDLIIAQSIFSHASRSQVEQCFASASKVMHKGSIFAATFVVGPSDYEGDEWVYPGCVTFKPATISEMAAAHGLRGEVIPVENHPTGQTWIGFQLIGSDG